MSPRSSAPRPTLLPWALLLGVTLAAAALVTVPVLLLHPFRPQSAAGVALAYALRRAAPWATLAALAAAVPPAVTLARRSRRRRQLLPIGLIGVALAGSAWFARQNHFEWMFRPVLDPAYAPVAEASWLAATDMVIAVELGGEAVAYPVRQLAFHHLVNATVGGRPVVSTY